ncbi:MAG: YraN family protein [Chloroflexota bacterium]
MSSARKRLGAWGESLAARHLEEEGYEILERNWRCARGEIDLVAQAGDLLVFVEVKTRRGRRMGLPEDGLTAHKGQKLLQLAERFLYEREIYEVNWRVDLVAVEVDTSGKLLRCEHIPDAVRGW